MSSRLVRRTALGVFIGMPTFRRLIAVCLIALLSTSGFAATATDLIPTTAPRGARVIVRGTDLDRGDLGVTFPDGATGSAATVHERASKYAEVSVPASAVSGNVRVTQGATQLASLPFTLAPDVVFASVATLAASDQAHDLLKAPGGIAIDPATGTIYVADTKHHQIKTISPQGVLGVLAGSGQPGLTDGAGTAARFHEPAGLAFDAAGQLLYVADSSNHAIRRVTLAGVVATLAGSGRPGDRDGQGATAELKQPMGVALDAAGTLFVTDTANSRVKRITPDGGVTTIAGTGGSGFADGGALDARFAEPEGIAVDASGTVLIADTGNNRIRRIAAGVVMTVAGSGVRGFADAVPSGARFDQPRGLALDEAGNLFIADSGNDVVRKLGSEGVSTVAGRPSSNSGHNALVDGPALQAQFDEPIAIAISGALVVADAGHDAIRIVLPQLRVSDVYPARGPLAGGNDVRIFGTGFVSGRTSVTVGGLNAACIVITSTELRITMPAHPAGPADIIITTLVGSVTLTGKYTYLAPPTVASISPTKGKTEGGQFTTLRGTEFAAGETEVLFGSAPALAVTVDDPTSATVTTPPNEQGPVDVIARTSVGESRLASAFRYFAPPVLAGFAPPSGYPGTTVVISGSHFDTDASGNVVRFGALTAPTISATATNISTVVPAGGATGRITVTTAGGTATSATDFVVPVLTAVTISPSSITLEKDETRQLTATGSWSDGSSREVTSLVTWASANAGVVSVSAAGLVRAESPGTAAVTATLEGITASASVIVEDSETLPPPSVEAPPLSEIEVTPISEATEFLYSGPNAVQTGMAPNALDPVQTSVVRGKVMTRDGAPLTGVDVAILSAPQYGGTKSRADGWFDMVVNGGSLTITYQKDGYLPAQRMVSAPWRDYLIAPDVVMIPLDSASTVVQAGAAEPQVARGSVAEDEDGRRQATLIFPAQTGVTMVMPDGSMRSLQSLTVRATEYSIGASGPSAMPATLPPTSGYTYCVELSADEAIAAGATEVRFTKPVAVYVENFIGFPVGGIVPAGYLDRKKGQWVASENGRVIKILDVSGTLAAIDINGDGVAEDATALALLGIDDAERQRLTTIYAAGTSLWRVPVGHFTPWDYNWPYGPPLGATGPGSDVPPPTPAYWINGGREECGSVIDCHNQSLGEVLRIPGVSFPLIYNTNRIASADKRTLTVQISGPNPPANAIRFELQVEYGGRKITRTYPVAPSVQDEIVLDLRDAYGRNLTGGVKAQVSVQYVYNTVYLTPADFARSFAGVSGIPLSGFDGERFGAEVTLSRNTEVDLSTGAINPLGVQGWSLGNHHVYDFGGQTLHEGSGGKRTSLASDPRSNALRTIAGTGRCCSSPVSGIARELPIDALYFAVAPNGEVYLNEWNKIRKVDRDGNISMFAGTGSDSGQIGEGPALERRIRPREVAVGPDGTLYFSETERIYKIREGMIERVAGGGASTLPKFGDGGPATLAYIQPRAFTVGPDSSIYFIDESLPFPKKTIRRISADGIIQTLYGGGTDTRNNIPATQAALPSWAITVGGDGTIYLTDSNPDRIRKIGTDGIIRLVAGKGTCFIGDSSGDGGPAALACLDDPFDVAVDRHGVVYIAEYNGGHIRMVTPHGVILSAAGNGVENRLAVEGGIATGTPVSFPWSVDVDAEGYVYFTEEGNRLRRIEPVMPKFSVGERFIASESGDGLYVFSGSRHLRTVDPLTQTTKYAFSYDQAGRVSAVTDVEGGLTTLERDASGKLTGVVAPTGGRTAVETNAAGQLTSLTIPGGARTQFGYSAEGRLTSMTNPRGHTTRFEYDAEGKLFKDSDPAGGFIRLFRTGTNDDFTVSTTTAMNRTKTDRLQRFKDGSETRTFTAATGHKVITSRAYTGFSTTTFPDGTVLRIAEGADPRFGMQAPIPASFTVTTPAGLTWSGGVSRTTTGPTLNPSTLIEATTMNGRSYTRTLDLASRVFTARSPSGRSFSGTVDEKGRATSFAVPGLASTSYSYGANGEISSIVTGGRSIRFSYDGSDRLVSATDTMNRTVTYEHDAAGRVIAQILSDNRRIEFRYDENGNLVLVQPPGRDAHYFSYTSADHAESYVPPMAGSTQYVYNLDKQLTSIIRPDGSRINVNYDNAGRTTSVQSSAGTRSYGYLATGSIGSITAPGLTLSYGYDGPLMTRTTWSGTVTGNVTWTYDTDFRSVSEAVNGTAISFGYDADSLLTGAGALTVTYDSQNALLMGTTLDKITDSYTYNEFGEVMGYNAAYDGTPLLSFNYARDAAGRITAIGEQGFEYDNVGRLVRVTNGGSAVAEYAYDANSNRTYHSFLGGSNTASYDGQDRLLTYGGAVHTYTPNGELKSKTIAESTTSYDYDALGNLRKVVFPGGRTIEYVIDGENRRVGKKIDGALVQGWLYADQLQIVAELDSSNTVVSRFVYGSHSNVPDYMIKGGVTYRILSDHLGSPRLVVNTADGTVVQSLSYAEFGNVLADTNSGFQPFGFAGGLYDRDTGLTRFGARDYDPHTGRWTAKDPIGFLGGDANLYGYVSNDPVNWIDPSGLQSGPYPPPPPSVPGGPWVWKANPQNSRGGTFADPSGRSASWDEPGNHWDIDQGDQTRLRYDNRGNPLTKEQAHGYRGPKQRPIDYSKRPKGPRGIRGLGRGMKCVGWLGIIVMVWDAYLDARDEEEFNSYCSQPGADRCACNPDLCV